MSTYKQPVGQKRLTNIAVVRVRKHGQRFEVACYKNKVMSWRHGIEKDMDEVLQAHTIFSNVGKGALAKSSDLIKAFGTDDEEVICRKILAEGEYQVSDKEREMVAGSQTRDVLFLAMERTVNPETQRPYSLGMIEKFAKELHFAVDPGKSSKQQALDLIRQLVQRFPIARAQMELRVTVPTQLAGSGSGSGSGNGPSALEQKLSEWHGVLCSIAPDPAANTTSAVFRVDPGMYRQCDAWAQANGGRLEVLSAAVQASGDISFDRLDDGLVASEHLRGSGPELLRESPQGSTAQVTGELGSLQLNDGLHLRGSVPAGDWPTGVGQGVQARPGCAAQDATVQAYSVRCTTCNAEVQSREAYREHCKAAWHKHNMRRKTRGLPPLSAEDCLVDMDLAMEKHALDEF